MNGDERMKTLETALRRLADETAAAQPPARIETALSAAVRRRRMARYPWWTAAAAALAMAGFWAATRQMGPAVGLEQAAAPAAVRAQLAGPAEAPAEAMDQPAEALPVAKPAVVRSKASSGRGELSGELSPLTPWYFSGGLPQPARGQIVFIRVNPQTALRFGVVSEGQVPAQLLIGDDGLTRAIRFVRE
ncbi:MAG: hypothetical protein C0504_07975 [Candidatus Solibacter sp.]|nr:hypothetical protein [Candidatus Solibacter sp.]